MNDLIKVDYSSGEPTVSARELHQFLEVVTDFRHWFPRMREYGFYEGVDFNLDIFDQVQIEGSREIKRTYTDYRLTIPMAKELKVGEKAFVNFLLDKKYIYRDCRGRIKPYAEKNSGLFEIKEAMNDKTGWFGTQTLVTPKGREKFMLMMKNRKGVTHNE